jgi:hypothetical protein
MKVPQQTRCYKEVRNISEVNIIDLCSSKQTETWIEVSRENYVEKKMGLLLQHFNYYSNISSPKLKRNTVSTSKSPWINKYAVIARMKLNDLYNLYVQSKTQDHRLSIKHIKRNTT